MRFGEFLLSKKLVNEDDLESALESQREFHRPMGKYAEELGFIDRRDNVRILLTQLQTKKRYGEVAQEMGLMDEVQVEKTLRAQERGALLLGQILVDKGCLTRERLVASLTEFVLASKSS